MKEKTVKIVSEGAQSADGYHLKFNDKAYVVAVDSDSFNYDVGGPHKVKDILKAGYEPYKTKEACQKAVDYLNSL